VIHESGTYVKFTQAGADCSPDRIQKRKPADWGGLSLLFS